MSSPAACQMCGGPCRQFGETWASEGRPVCSEPCAVAWARFYSRAGDDYGESKARIMIRRSDYPGPGRALWAIRMLQAQGWRIVEETTDGGVMWQDHDDPSRNGLVQAKTTLEFENRREFEGRA